MADLFDRLAQERAASGDLFDRLTPEERSIGAGVLRDRAKDMRWGDTPEELRPENLARNPVATGFDHGIARDELGQSTIDRIMAEEERRAALTPSAERAGDLARDRRSARVDEPEPSVVDQVVGAAEHFGRSLAAAPMDLSAGLWGLARAAVANINDNPITDIKHARGERSLLDPVTDWLAEAQRSTQDRADSIYGAAPDSFVGSALKQGVRSVPQSVTALGLAALGNPGAGIALLSGQTSGQAFGEAADAGLSPPHAALYGFEQGSVEWLTERFPILRYLNDTKAGSSFGRKLLNNLANELPGEQAATALQDFNQWVNLHPEKTLGDYVRERPDAQLSTAIATAVGSTLAVGAEHAASSTLRRVAQRPVAPGVRESAISEAAQPTEDDIASPIPTDLIVEGKAAVADAQAASGADSILDAAGMPRTGRRVSVDMGDGRSMTGTVADAFDTDAGEAGRARGIRIAMDDGSEFAEHFDTLADAGVRIVEQSDDPVVRELLERTDAMELPGVTGFASPESAQSDPAPAPPAPAGSPTPPSFDSMVAITLGSESGNRDFAPDGSVLTSPKGAKGKMQVLDGTNRDPGFGVRPAKDDSLEERARVGRDYLAAMMKRYDGDAAKAWGAYNAGPVTVDALVAKHGAAWLDHAPAETRAYVAKNVAALGGNVDVTTVATGEGVRFEDIQFEDRPRREGFGLIETTLPEPVAEPVAEPVETEARPEVEPLPIDVGSGREPIPEPVSINPTPNGKSIAIAGASPEQLDLIRAAVPDVRPIRRADGATVYAKRYADRIAEALAATSGQQGQDLAGPAIDEEWTAFTPDSGTLGVPRAEMPQIKAEHRGAMVNFLNARGVAHVEETVAATALKPTQAEFSTKKVAKAKVHEGGDRAILVSSDGHVLDGHHQWLAARDNGGEVRAIRLDAPIRQLLDLVPEFPSADVADGATAASPSAGAPLPGDRADEATGGGGPDLAAPASPAATEAQPEPQRVEPAPVAPVPEPRAGEAPDRTAEAESRDDRVPVYEEGDSGRQIGWLDPATGALSRIDSEPDTEATADRSTSPAIGNLAGDAPASSAPSQSRVPGLLDGIEPIIVDDSAVKGWTDLRDLRRKVQNWILRNLRGTVTDARGNPVIVSTRGLKHSLFGNQGDALLRSALAIPEIIRRGRVIRTETGLPKAPDVAMVEWIAAPVIVGGETHDVAVLIRVMRDGRRQYDLAMAERVVGARLNAGGAASRTLGTPDSEGYPDGLNLFLLDEQFNDVIADEQAEAGANWGQVRADLEARLRELGIADRIVVNVVSRIGNDPRTAGQYFNRVITIALDERGQTPLFTLNHEAIHGLRDLGLFLPDEWRALERAASNDAAMMESVRRRYPDLAPEQQLEEAIADRFARWASGEGDQRGFVARVFERVRDFLAALGDVLRGRGFTTAESVMRAIERGDVGRRADGGGGAPGPRQSRTEAAGVSSPLGRATDQPLSGSANRITGLIDAIRSDGPLGTKASAAWDSWRTAIQDRFLPLLRTQQAIERDLGRRLDEAENPYLGEELMTGRIGAQLEQLTDEMVEPLFGAMHSEGVSLDELETYLYARHAPERNARIAAINPSFGEGEGSGMADAEAAEIMAAVDESAKREALDRLAARVDAILAFALQTRVDAGLLSKAEADIWRAQYQHYVPLRGRAEMDAGAGLDLPRPSRSTGIDVKGKESKRAFGRKSRADDILAYTIMQAEEALVRAETNRVAQQFFALAQAAPDPTFWVIDKVERRAVWNKAKGQVEYQSQSRISAEDAPFTVSVKIDGDEHRVTMNRANPAAVRLADAMRNLSAQQLQWVVRFGGAINRFLSAVNTQLNPEFVITNAFRDIQTAGINLNQYDQAGIVSGTLRDYPKALAASLRGSFKASKGEWGKIYREFISEGGRVYFNQTEDLEAIKRRVQSTLKQVNDKAEGRLTARRAFYATRDFINNANGGVENAIRLSAYKNARERGMSKRQAASLAKNLTVNFNRRGTYGSGINAAYLFFNASVQGTAVLLTAAKSKRVQKVLFSAALLGAAVELLNSMIGGDDDDGEPFYDKISAFDKSRNLIIMVPGGKGEHFKIPLPYGYSAFFEAGRTAAEIARRGGEGAMTSVANLTTAIIDSFNPVGGTESILNFIAPTLFDPLVDLDRNRDFADRPILPEQSQYGPPKPDAQRHWGSVAPHWKAVTDFLSDTTGGTDVEAGAIDISPETLEYLQGYAFGAAGQTVGRVIGLGEKLLDPDPEAEIGANDLPLVRKVVGQKPSWYDKAAYYDRVGQIEKALAEVKDYQELDQIAEAERYVDKHYDVLSLERPMKAARKEMRQIRKAKAANELALELGRIDDAAHREEKAALVEAENLIIAEFNGVWNEVMRPKQ